MHSDWIIPDWPAPAVVRSVITTRQGGVSTGPYASMNPAAHVGDAPIAVEKNRALLRAELPNEPRWLDQVHGIAVAQLDQACDNPYVADGAVTRERGQVCAVLTADCLPVLFCSQDGRVVAAAHAGWRGLAAGVLEQSVRAMAEPADQIMAYLGPAIGPRRFEVGAEVQTAFCIQNAEAEKAFVPQGEGKFLANLYLLARQRLQALGLTQIYGGEFCTASDSARFFSYRRDGQTGRMAALIWLA